VDEMSTGTEIVKANGAALAPERTHYRPTNFAPRNFGELVEFSKLVANSDLAPKEYKGKPGNVMIAIQMGAEVGLSPMQAVQNIAVINGKPSLYGDALLAVVQAHPDYERHEEFLEGSGETRVAVCRVQRRGSEMHEERFGVADAKRANLWGKAGPWQQYPDRMMQMRARSFALRNQFADALKGIIAAEEAMDYPVQETQPQQRSQPQRKSEPKQHVESDLEKSLYLTDEDVSVGTNALPEDSNETQKAPKGTDRITREQATQLHALWKQKGLKAQAVIDYIGSLGAENSLELTQDQLVQVVRWIEEEAKGMAH
jgi:hypothetical protein